MDRIQSILSIKNLSSVDGNQRGTRKELIDLITCKLCRGYLIDAATLDLCMHSFCRPCAIKFIKQTPKCPECHTEIKDKRFMNRLKIDTTLQNIVYKLVPGLYEKEMADRRKFYASRPTPTPRYKSEMFGDIPPSKQIKSDELLDVCIRWDKSLEEPIKTYLHCRADSTIFMIRKFIMGKFGLTKPIKIFHGKNEIFFDLTTLMDIAAAFDWAPEKKIITLNIACPEPENNNLNNNYNSNNNIAAITSI